MSVQLNANDTPQKQMETVKSCCGKAADGPKKDAAMKHYHDAETALKAKDNTACITACKAAMHELA